MNMLDRLKELEAKATDYLAQGGLFNPESMEHEKVRDLVMEMRNALPRLIRIAEAARNTCALIAATKSGREDVGGLRRLNEALSDLDKETT